MAIGAFHVSETQGPMTVMAMCLHRVAIQLSSLCSGSYGRKKQHCRQTQKRDEEENVGPLIGRLVFGNGFGVEGSGLERFTAMRTGCRVSKAETTTAETPSKTHYYLFLVSGRGFMLIARDECFQDGATIKSGTTV